MNTSRLLCVGLVAIVGCGGKHKPASSEGAPSAKRGGPASDTVTTSAGDLVITPIYHASLMFTFAGKHIHVDPSTKGDYTALPKADLILITDIHGDHLDLAALAKLRGGATTIIAPDEVIRQLAVAGIGGNNVKTLPNNQKTEWNGIPIEAVPMYNLVRGPEPGKLFHDKGRGNGYVLTFGDQRIYLSGDTECIPEMKALTAIDIAFVCMNLPYTMTPAEAGECIRAFRPHILYPYHHRESKLTELGELDGIDVRLRSWY